MFIWKEAVHLATKNVWLNLSDGLFMLTAGLASVYATTTFGPKLSLQNKIKSMKAKIKELMLAHNDQIIS
jgi:hypothetical protein